MSDAKPAEPAPEAKPKTQKAKAPSGGGLARSLNALSSGMSELSGSLRSPDLATRKMTVRFFLSLLGVLAITSVTVIRLHQFSKNRRRPLTDAEKSAKHLSEFLGKQAEEAKRRGTQLSLGDFSVELKALEGQKRVRGVQNLVEMEIVIECNNRDTVSFIEGHMIQIRDEITDAFAGMERDDIFTRDGKTLLKKKITDRLNLWLEHVPTANEVHRKIEHLYFNKLLVN